MWPSVIRRGLIWGAELDLEESQLGFGQQYHLQSMTKAPRNTLPRPSSVARERDSLTFQSWPRACSFMRNVP